LKSGGGRGLSEAKKERKGGEPSVNAGKAHLVAPSGRGKEEKEREREGRSRRLRLAIPSH